MDKLLISKPHCPLPKIVKVNIMVRETWWAKTSTNHQLWRACVELEDNREDNIDKMGDVNGHFGSLI